MYIFGATFLKLKLCSGRWWPNIKLANGLEEYNSLKFELGYLFDQSKTSYKITYFCWKVC